MGIVFGSSLASSRGRNSGLSLELMMFTSHSCNTSTSKYATQKGIFPHVYWPKAPSTSPDSSAHLRHVVLRFLVGVHPGDLRLSWGRLTRIDLGNTPTRTSKFLKIMEQSFALEDGVFYINFADSSNRQSLTFQIIVVPLVRLRLRLIHPSHDVGILR